MPDYFVEYKVGRAWVLADFLVANSDPDEAVRMAAFTLDVPEARVRLTPT